MSVDPAVHTAASAPLSHYLLADAMARDLFGLSVGDGVNRLQATSLQPSNLNRAIAIALNDLLGGH